MNKNIFRAIRFAAGFLLLAITSVYAQVSTGGIPRSFSMAGLPSVPTVVMPDVNVQNLLAEDEQAGKDVPYRFGAPIDVNLNLNNSGIWTDLADGGRLWQLRIASPGAHSINLLYDEFYLPEGAELYLYNEIHDDVIGAFTSMNNFETGKFSSAPVKDDAINLEYYEPAEVVGQGVISVFRVVHAYRNLFGRPSPLDNFGDSGTCENDVMCAVAALWQDDKHGAAMILDGGFRLCSGSLVGNTATTTVPYFLTANHCLGGEAGWTFMFNYESPTCDGVDGPTNQTVTNATLRATNTASDFALLELSSTVPPIYSPFYCGWNRVNSAATSSVCIHHPEGDVKKISFDNNAPTSSTWTGTPANSHWRILTWDDGVTEPGSSGSPLYDQNHRITGQLHGGSSACVPFNPNDDYYGKFSMSWNGNGSGSPSARLQDWLDPDAGAAPNTVDGYYGPIASITVTSPNGGESLITGVVHTITWTSANITQNVKIELSRNGGGSWENITASTANDGTHNWTVAGASTTTALVRISVVLAPSVLDVSDAVFSIGPRSITVTTPNGGENWIEGTNQNITWTSQNVTGNVNIELSRNSGGSWENVVSNTANDGTHSWPVTLPATTQARIRVTSVSFPTTLDMSNADFTIAARTITVTAPNGGENWPDNANQTIMWTSQNVTGNVNIELSRNGGGSWENIVSNTLNDGSHTWMPTLPATIQARVRVTSVDFPAVSDMSDANFTIIDSNTPPILTHDRLDDQNEAAFSVTAIATDDTGGLIVRFFYRLVGAVNYDSLAMPATGNPNEFAATVGALPPGEYEYFVRGRDIGGLTASTAVLNYEIREFCGLVQGYDDGSAEASHWADNEGFRWAVKFDHGAGAFTLCRATIGVSALHPTTVYSPLEVQVLLADGLGGLPGTVVMTKSVGSLGNVIGGVPTLVDNFVDVVFSDGLGGDLVLLQDFYVAVSNPGPDAHDAFLHDSGNPTSGRSYVYDACDAMWMDETTVHESARLGDRMIRVYGAALVPPEVVIYPSGNDLVLTWANVGAPYYIIRSSLVSGGPYSTIEGSTSLNTFTDLGGASTSDIRFYVVTSSTTP